MVIEKREEKEEERGGIGLRKTKFGTMTENNSLSHLIIIISLYTTNKFIYNKYKIIIKL